MVFNWYVLNLPFRLSNQDPSHVVYSDFRLTTLSARFAFRDSRRAFLRLLCSAYGTNHNKNRANSYYILHSYLGPTYFNLKDPFINKTDHKIQENILHNIIGWLHKQINLTTNDHRSLENLPFGHSGRSGSPLRHREQGERIGLRHPPYPGGIAQLTNQCPDTKKCCAHRQQPNHHSCIKRIEEE